MENFIRAARRCSKGGMLSLRFREKRKALRVDTGNQQSFHAAASRHQAGGDRQDLHEKIRVHSMAAGMAVKGEGKPNDLMDRVAGDPAFEAVHGDKLASLIDPALFIGRSPEQVCAYLCYLAVPIVAWHLMCFACHVGCSFLRFANCCCRALCVRWWGNHVIPSLVRQRCRWTSSWRSAWIPSSTSIRHC